MGGMSGLRSCARGPPTTTAAAAAALPPRRRAAGMVREEGSGWVYFLHPCALHRSLARSADTALLGAHGPATEKGPTATTTTTTTTTTAPCMLAESCLKTDGESVEKQSRRCRWCKTAKK